MLLKPMSEFDPSEPALLHDALNDRTIPWSPDFQPSFEKLAIPLGSRMVGYDGLILDGWLPLEDAPGEIRQRH
jgi:hypothetical protein